MMCISLFSYGRPVVVRCKVFGLVWVGLGHGSISSPGSGLGWVGSVIWWVGLGWVDENRPTDNSVFDCTESCVFLSRDYLYTLPLAKKTTCTARPITSHATQF